jgi:hypothetical protein
MSLLMYEGRGVMVVKTVCLTIVLTADAFRRKLLGAYANFDNKQ